MYIQNQELPSDYAKVIHGGNNEVLWQMRVAQCLLQESQLPYRNAVVQFPFGTVEM